jgi:hypothetical protein
MALDRRRETPTRPKGSEESRQIASVVVANRWDEAGLRRDAVRSQVIDSLEAHEIKQTGNEEGSTTAAKQIRNFSEQKLTIGLDLGDRSSSYCVLDEAGRIVVEEKLSTTPKAMQAVFGACRGAGSRWRPGRIRPG